ncbi:response regulator transcription factor [Bordetella sp. H567]|uniref:response regulator transcription factor n=1 Tax=Bordetella sp. H567 TaxID=1697043 RepID=UPI0009F6BA25|nr:response regulator [Bordetella sp. H567]
MTSSHAMKQGGRLLLVDDSPADLRLLVQLLNHENFKLMVALDGKQAYERATAQPAPDVILMDVSMPRVDGYATCRLLKGNPRTAHIPVIFITASASLDERLKGFDAGAADYVPKPYNPEEVLARVRVQLQKAQRATVPCTAPETKHHHPPANTPGASVDQALRFPSISNEQAIVNTTRQYLADHLSDAPSQKRLARLIGVNEKRLTNAFRSLLGKTIHDYLRDQRMEKARTLLQDCSLTVAEIADQLGFSSPANFASAFRRQLGCSPVAFRRHLGEPVSLIERANEMPKPTSGVFQKV